MHVNMCVCVCVCLWARLVFYNITYKIILLMQMEELRAENQLSSESSGSIGRSKGSSIQSSQQISVTVVTEFVRWNEEAITRCSLFSSQVKHNYLSTSIVCHSSSFNINLSCLTNYINDSIVFCMVRPFILCFIVRREIPLHTQLYSYFFPGSALIDHFYLILMLSHISV